MYFYFRLCGNFLMLERVDKYQRESLRLTPLGKEIYQARPR